MYNSIFNNRWRPGGCPCLTYCHIIFEENSIGFADLVTKLTNWLNNVICLQRSGDFVRVKYSLAKSTILRNITFQCPLDH